MLIVAHKGRAREIVDIFPVDGAVVTSRAKAKRCASCTMAKGSQDSVAASNEAPRYERPMMPLSFP